MGKVTPRPIRRGHPGAPQPLHPITEKSPSIAGVIFLMLLHMVSLFAIELAMTPLTNNLDDIKQTIYYCICPALMTLSLIGIYFKMIPLPPKWAGRGLAAYWIIMIISTLYMATAWRQASVTGISIRSIRWMGWDQVLLVWGAGGLFLSAMSACSNKQTHFWFIRYLVIQWLIVNLIGYAMFSISSTNDHRSIVSLFCDWMYPTEASQSGNGFALLATLRGADQQMQSTVLNRDFYAGLSLLYLPFGILLAAVPGPSRRPFLWRILGGVTAMLTALSVFLCQSKGEYIFFVVMAVYIPSMVFLFGALEKMKKRHITVALASALVVIGIMAWMKSPTLVANLKSFKLSFSSRAIMWNAAGKIFLDFPILGGGPGSYRAYFSTYRAPDYFLHEIANVTTFSHNYFLDLLAETGVLGFAAFITFLSSIWLAGFRWAIKHPSPQIRMIMIALTASLIGMFGSNMSSPNARWIIGACNLWTVMGVLTGSLRLAEGWQQRTGDFGATPRGRLAGKYSLLGLIVLSLPILGVSIQSGLAYWNSAVKYAAGLQFMEGGMQMLQRSDGKDAEYIKSVLQQSCTLFEDAIKTDKTNVSGYYKLGSVYSTLDRMFETQAQSAAGSARETMTATSDQYCQLALDRYQTLDQLMPDYAEIHYNFGIVYDRMASVLERQAAAPGVAKEAAATLRKTAADYETKSRAHMERMHLLSVKEEVYELLAGQYQSKGLYEDALKVFREAVTRYPENSDLIRRYHDTAMMTNNLEDMVKALRMLWHNEKLDPQYIVRMFGVCQEGKLAVQLGELANEMMRNNPLDPRVYSARVILANWRNDSQDIIAEAERYRKTGGRQAAVYQIAAKAAASIGKADKAAEFQRDIQQLSQPPQPGAANVVEPAMQ